MYIINLYILLNNIKLRILMSQSCSRPTGDEEMNISFFPLFKIHSQYFFQICVFSLHESDLNSGCLQQQKRKCSQYVKPTTFSSQVSLVPTGACSWRISLLVALSIAFIASQKFEEGRNWR